MKRFLIIAKEYTECNYIKIKIWFYVETSQEIFSYYGKSNYSVQNINPNYYNFVHLDFFLAYVSNM